MRGLSSLGLSVCLLAGSASAASTAFTYQGRLVLNGQPITDSNGTYAVAFTLWDSPGTGNPPTGGNQIGPRLLFDASDNFNAITFVNGLFTVQLDFGAGAWIGSDRWLAISISTDDFRSTSTTLSPRQFIAGTPYSLSTRGLFVDASNHVGIGSTTPGFPLTFASTSGDKISLWGQSGAHYGFGIQAGLLQIYTDMPTSDVAFGYGQSGSFTENVRITGDGMMGIGTSTPAYKLDVRRTIGGGGIAINGEDSGGGIGVMGTANVGGRGVEGLAHGTNAGVGVWAESDASSLNGAALRVNNTNAAGIGIWSTTTSTDGNVILTNSGTGSLIRGFNGGCCPVFEVQNSGHTVVPVLEITGGSDLAEPFDVNDADPQPGMVVAIDPDHPGQLRIAREAYDPRVAGIVSGAGGVHPGLSMRQSGSVAAGKHDVALSGRVYCWCDATAQPIHIGNFLTTSTTPGHAIAVTDHARAQGAIIGKAMTALEKGRGLVLVLVTLQ